jgi:hypothetical protein
LPGNGFESYARISLAYALFRSFAAINVIPQGNFCDLAGAILVAAPTIPVQQGEEGPKPLLYGFSHETLMDKSAAFR